MRKLKEVVGDAVEQKIAIGHFNIATFEMFNAVIDAAKDTGLPVIIGVSEGERDFVGIKNIVALVKQAQSEGLEVYLNADHTYSLKKTMQAIDTGFDSVIIDGAKLSYEENVAQTKELTAYAAKNAPHVLIEAELGYIGMSSKVIDEVPEGVNDTTLTNPEEAATFVAETDVDLLAPSVGNMHGMFKGGKNPGELKVKLIKEITERSGVPLVLHGGSGTSDEDFVAAAQAGTAIIHVSTEMRVAYRKGLEDVLQGKADELAPYRLLTKARENVKMVVLDRMNLFAGRSNTNKK